MRIILIAPPGAGKGTHGQRIAARYDVPRLATGDLFRAELEKGSELGQRAARYVERGDLVPDEIVVELLREPVSRMSRAGGGYVLDGFPRTLRQAQLAAAVADGGDLRADVVVALDVPREVLVDRLLARNQGRSDDTAETIAHRLDVYERETAPLLDYYDGRAVLHRVTAVGEIDEVSARIFAELDAVGSG